MLQSGSLHQHFDTFTSFWSKSIILEWRLGVFPNLPVLYIFLNLFTFCFYLFIVIFLQQCNLVVLNTLQFFSVSYPADRFSLPVTVIYQISSSKTANYWMPVHSQEIIIDKVIRGTPPPATLSSLFKVPPRRWGCASLCSAESWLHVDFEPRHSPTTAYFHKGFFTTYDTLYSSPGLVWKHQ